jgi:hypothetical protein
MKIKNYKVIEVIHSSLEDRLAKEAFQNINNNIT